MGLKLGDLSPVYGAIKGEGMFGDLLGKKSKNEAAAKLAADKAAADEAEAKKAAQSAKNMAVLRSQGMGGGMSGGMKKGGKVSSASSRADGIAVKGKTRGRMV
jgi:membrane protein involved in colicin uptake